MREPEVFEAALAIDDPAASEALHLGHLSPARLDTACAALQALHAAMTTSGAGDGDGAARGPQACRQHCRRSARWSATHVPWADAHHSRRFG